MKRGLCLALACLALASARAAAHEFWLWPETFAPALGGSARLTLNVGENFEGERIGFAASNVAALRVYSRGKTLELRDRIPGATVLPALALALTVAGTHLVAFDSQPTRLTLSADKFHAYLHEEGLDAIIKQREAAGTASAPGRERFRRHVKTLLRVGGKADATYAVRSGQRMEIVPLADPFAKAAGDTLQFKLAFDDRPLINALVKAWHKRDGQTLIIRAHSNAEGRVTFTLPWAGPWMVSFVHMIPASDSPDIDWDSFWGNLTFELPARRK